jgi:hypothetical protein
VAVAATAFPLAMVLSFLIEVRIPSARAGPWRQ